MCQLSKHSLLSLSIYFIFLVSNPYLWLLNRNNQLKESQKKHFFPNPHLHLPHWTWYQSLHQGLRGCDWLWGWSRRWPWSSWWCRKQQGWTEGRCGRSPGDQSAQHRNVWGAMSVSLKSRMSQQCQNCLGCLGCFCVNMKSGSAENRCVEKWASMGKSGRKIITSGSVSWAGCDTNAKKHVLFSILTWKSSRAHLSDWNWKQHCPKASHHSTGD